MASTSLLATCNACRARKVRCEKRHESDEVCISCARRKEACHFSQPARKHNRRANRQQSAALRERAGSLHSSVGCTSMLGEPTDKLQNQPGNSHSLPEPVLPSPAASRSLQATETSADKHFPRLHIDNLLTNSHAHELRGEDNDKVIIAGNKYAPSSTLSYFSEKKISSLTSLLGHSDVRHLINHIDSDIARWQERSKTVAKSPIDADAPSEEVIRQGHRYITVYFDQVHPLYPFLNRSSFEAIALSSDLLYNLSNDKPWAALYYAVLSLGCIHDGGGSFAPASGEAHKYFQTAVSLLPEMLLVRRTLATAQAMLAMAIYAMNYCCLSLEDVPIAQAASIALSLGLGKRYSHPGTEVEQSRTFWTIYCLEKELSFHTTRSSAISDSDIGIPLTPTRHESLAELDWLCIWASYCRIMSRAYERLFSVSATLNSDEVYHDEIDRTHDMLREWKDLIPREYRPGKPNRIQYLENNITTAVKVRIFLLYYNLVTALSRLELHIGEGKYMERHSQSKAMLMESARSILEITQFIPIAPSTPTWILGHLPLVATFILFEFVVHNPTHIETARNLSFLDVSAGYFSRADLISGGDMHGEISQFSHIARSHVMSQREALAAGSGPLGASLGVNGSQEDGGCRPGQNIDRVSHGASGEPCDSPMQNGGNAATPRLPQQNQNVFDAQANFEMAAYYDDGQVFNFDDIESLNYPVDYTLISAPTFGLVDFGLGEFQEPNFASD